MPPPAIRITGAPHVTPQQSLFVHHYLVGLNAADAARRAGYSERSARQIGYKLLREPDVADAIKAAREAREARLSLSADEMVAELKRLFWADPGAVGEWDGTDFRLKPSSLLTPAERRSIAEIAITSGAQGVSVKVKQHGKYEAARLLKDLLGWGVNPDEMPEEDVDKMIGGDGDPEIDDRGEG